MQIFESTLDIQYGVCTVLSINMYNILCSDFFMFTHELFVYSLDNTGQTGMKKKKVGKMR